MQGGGRGNRVHPVERVRDVDDPFLLTDRLDRLGERHPARDLVPEEQPDHLAVPLRLDLLSGDHDQVAVPRELNRLQGAREDVVVGDRDRAEPLRLGVVDERHRLDRAVVRTVRVHVQIGDDPLAVGERLGLVGARCPPAPRSVRIEPLEPLGEGGEAPVLDALLARCGVSLAGRGILGEAEERSRRELGLRRHPRRVDERASRDGRLLAQPA